MSGLFSFLHFLSQLILQECDLGGRDRITGSHYLLAMSEGRCRLLLEHLLMHLKLLQSLSDVVLHLTVFNLNLLDRVG